MDTDGSDGPDGPAPATSGTATSSALGAEPSFSAISLHHTSVTSIVYFIHSTPQKQAPPDEA